MFEELLSSTNMVIKNKYFWLYIKLCENNLNNKVKHDCENHHVLPKSIYDNSILVLLTYREHYICHLLLTKFTTGIFNDKMLYAFNMLSNRYKKNGKYNSKLYAKTKQKHRILNKINQTGVLGNFYGRKHTKETKLKISRANKGNKHTDKAKYKMKNYATNRIVSSETKLKMRNSKLQSLNFMFNKNHSIQTKLKISKSLKNYYNKNKVSDYTRYKLSLSNSGKNNGMYGKTHKDNSKLKISKSLKEWYANNIISDITRKKLSDASIGCKNPAAKKCIINSIVYYSLKEAATNLNVCTKTIRLRIQSIKYPNYKYI